MKSLELRWLARKDKYIRLPEVVFVSGVNYGGSWVYPRKKEILLDGRYYPLDLGIITLNTDFPEEHESSIAHEWRHVWQTYNWGEKQWHTPWGSEPHLSYKQQIVNYFSHDVREWDALLFTIKTAPRPHDLMWYRWVLEGRQE